MKAIFFLSRENFFLARDEVLSIFSSKNCKIIDRKLLILDISYNDIPKLKRLAYTRKVCRLLFSSAIKNIEKSLEKFDWNPVYRKDFCLRIKYLDNAERINDFDEKKLAGHIWRTVKKPKVNLENAKTKIELVFAGRKVFCCLEIYAQNEFFEERKAHKRPALHPISLHPKLARCLVNLSGVSSDEVILDPFCGTGGILIESSLMGIDSVGYDIDEDILNKCRKNLSFVKAKKVKLVCENSLKLKKKFDFIVTDLPYGKSTKRFDAEKFYREFILMLKRILNKKAVVVFPDNFEYDPLIRKTGLNILGEYSYYIHKTMSKRIVVVEKR